MSQRDENQIYLSAIREGDRWKIVDQNGRTVAGVRSIEVVAGYEESTLVRVEFLDAPMTSKGVAYVAR